MTRGASSPTVLVTGVGAVTGYGFLRSLRSERPDVRLVGTDIHADAVGARWCDHFVQAPLSLSAEFPQWLLETTHRLDVDLVVPTLDADLDCFAAQPGILRRLPCTVALNSTTAVTLSRDKWSLDQALAATGDPSRIPSSQATDFHTLSAELGLPFLVKARRGQGGRGMARIGDHVELSREVHRIPDEAFCQRLVGCDEEEYTVGVFGDGAGETTAQITMRRRLARDGMTRRVEAVATPADLDDTLRRLARLVRPCGPTNFQLRRDGETWHLLEVNARLSSSSSLRALFGYHEATMTLDWYLGGTMPEQPPVAPGVATRYVEDVMLDDGTAF